VRNPPRVLFLNKTDPMQPKGSKVLGRFYLKIFAIKSMTFKPTSWLNQKIAKKTLQKMVQTNIISN
jgi:hypothetical protein